MSTGAFKRPVALIERQVHCALEGAVALPGVLVEHREGPNALQRRLALLVDIHVGRSASWGH